MVEAKVTITPCLHGKASPKTQPKEVKEGLAQPEEQTTFSHWEGKVTGSWALLLHSSPSHSFSQAGVGAFEKSHLAVPGELSYTYSFTGS